MSIAGGGGEIHTVRLVADPAAGGTDTVEVDAQEDREIVGFDFQPDALAENSSYKVFAEAFVGVHPNLGGESNDIGSKFFIRAVMRMVWDSAAGHVHEAWSMPSDFEVDSGLSWDWNEDVTLSLRASEAAGDGADVSIACTIYYREV